MTAVAQRAFEGTPFSSAAKVVLFAVYVAVCATEIARLLRPWVKRGAPLATAAWRHAIGGACRAAAGARHAFRSLTETKYAPKRPTSRWVRRAVHACGALFGGWFAFYSFAWFGVTVATVLSAVIARAPGATAWNVSRAAACALTFVVLARMFWVTACDSWYQLRHDG